MDKNDEEVDNLYASTFHTRRPYSQRRHRPTGKVIIVFNKYVSVSSDMNNMIYRYLTYD